MLIIIYVYSLNEFVCVAATRFQQQFTTICRETSKAGPLGNFDMPAVVSIVYSVSRVDNALRLAERGWWWRNSGYLRHFLEFGVRDVVYDIIFIFIIIISTIGSSLLALGAI